MTAGRRRGLDQLATARGAVALGLLRTADPDQRGPLCAALAPHLSGVVLDAASASAAIDAGQLPGRCGLAIDLGDGGPEPRLAPGWSPASVRRLGASAGYLRVALRPDRPALLARSLRLAQLAAELSHGEGLPLVLHGVVSRLPGESAGAFEASREELAAAASRELSTLDADLLVAPLAAGARLRRAWVVELGAAGPDEASDELERALRLGARGFAAGQLLSRGPADPAWQLDVAAPLAAALRETVEEGLVRAA